MLLRGTAYTYTPPMSTPCQQAQDKHVSSLLSMSIFQEKMPSLNSMEMRLLSYVNMLNMLHLDSKQHSAVNFFCWFVCLLRNPEHFRIETIAVDCFEIGFILQPYKESSYCPELAEHSGLVFIVDTRCGCQTYEWVVVWIIGGRI